jgi:hypothetical protein
MAENIVTLETKDNHSVSFFGSDEYIGGMEDGRESLATEILIALDEYPNNVERIERIRELCNTILNHKKQVH